MRLNVLLLGCLATSLGFAQIDEVSASDALAAVLADMRGTESRDPASVEKNRVPNDPTADFVTSLPMPPPALQSKGTVTVASLRHKIPKEAEKAFKRSAKLSKSGNLREAARELEKAVAGDPLFAEAQMNLGTVYLRIGQYSAAQEAMLRGISLDPSSSAAYSNLAALYLTTGDLGAAESNARRALALSSTNSRAHYLLGLLLLGSPQARPEALRHLEYAARELPAAATTLSKLR